MNSATLKPVSPQNSSVPNQINKPMHPQGSPAYSQPSGHMPQNPFPNMNAAHNHPNSQQNHFSLNVPNTSPHYNIGSIPPSNHPVANVSQSATGLQSYTPPKTVAYSSSFQSNVAHSPNRNVTPPPQVLPTTQPSPVQQQTSPQNLSHPSNTSSAETEEVSEKPQSNGTPEEKPTESEVQDNHVPTESSDEQPHVQRPVSPQVVDKPKESPSVVVQPVQEEKPLPEPTKVPEEVTTSPIPLAAHSTSITQPPADETDPLAIDTSETVPSLSEPEIDPEPEPEPEETVESPEELAESVSIEEAVTQQNSESISTSEGKDVEDKDIEEEEEEDEEEEEKSGNENVSENNADIEVDEKLSSEKESSSDVKPVSMPREVKKPKTPKPKEVTKPKTPVAKTPSSSKAEKRQRTRTQPYQSPLPEIEIITKISSTTPRRSRGIEDKLIYFYKNEFLAVRNAEGGFYLCQAVQNIYKSSSKIKIRWLSQDKADKSGEIYTPDFYDLTDFDCILTSLDLVRVGKGKYRLTKAEKERTDSILNRSLAVEKGEIVSPSVSQEHPDGLDLSLYKDEEQLKKKKRASKRKLPSRPSPAKTPTKKTPEAPKVRKVETVIPKKVSPPTRSKKPTSTVTTATPAATTKKPTPAPTLTEPKKAPASTSRASRGKRKSDTKTSPVVDQKKAKVLAKIGRKTAVPASTSRSQSSSLGKSGKVTKPVPSPIKSAPANAKSSVATRKNKRSTRK